MMAIAIEKGWTIERLLIHLGLKEPENQQDLRFNIKAITINMSLSEQIELLAWISENVHRSVRDQPSVLKSSANINNRNILIIFELEDIAIAGTNLRLAQLASQYVGNLVEYLQAKSKNILISTIDRIPETLADTDLLIFDISTADSASISFIEDLKFNGEIIIFAEAAALTVIRERLGDCVSSIFSKPFDWSTLKSQPFFQRID